MPLTHNMGTLLNPGDTASGGQGAPVDGDPCGDMVLTYHIHSHLSLFYNGQKIALPVAIGIVNPQIFLYQGKFRASLEGKCFYHTHTHDDSGLIHVEGNVRGIYTLGDVFDKWGEPLSTSPVNVAGFMGASLLIYTANCTRTVPFTCDPPVQYTGDPRAIVLAQHQQITIEVGGPYVWPPYYRW